MIKIFCVVPTSIPNDGLMGKTPRRIRDRLRTLGNRYGVAFFAYTIYWRLFVIFCACVRPTSGLFFRFTCCSGVLPTLIELAEEFDGIVF